MLQDIALLSDILRRNIYIDRCQILNIFWMIRCLASTSFTYTIKGPVCFVKISQEDSPTRVAMLSAFVANGRIWVEITCWNLLDRVPTKNNQHGQRQQRALLFVFLLLGSEPVEAEGARRPGRRHRRHGHAGRRPLGRHDGAGSGTDSHDLDLGSDL